MPRRPETFVARIVAADRGLFREVKIEAARREVPIAVVWNEIVRNWLERRGAPTAASPPDKEVTD